MPKGGYHMSKKEIIDAMAASANLKKADAEKALNAMVDAVSGALMKGDKVQLVGFGTFEVRTRNARKGRNPRTGATIDIKASKNVAFRAGKALKDKL